MLSQIETRINQELVKKVTGEYDLEVIQWLELPNIGIQRIEKLSPCINMRTLNLSGNQVIQKIVGLDGLLSLERLDLSSNRVKRIENLSHLTSLHYLDLKGNQISSVDDVATLTSLPHLRRFLLQGYQGNKMNPACQHPSYHMIVTRLLPRLDMLDNESTNLRKCMVDLVLENLKADTETIESPKPQRWCAGFGWTVEAPSAETDESLRAETETLFDLLNSCRRLHRQASDILRQL